RKKAEKQARKERQRAEKAEQQAEKEHQRAEKLAAMLRKLGMDTD
ncbi:MAG: Uma2 family endonuclease, partial [Deltaproteobacteria bacterium]